MGWHNRAEILPPVLLLETTDICASSRLVPVAGGMAAVIPKSATGYRQHTDLGRSVRNSSFNTWGCNWARRSAAVRAILQRSCHSDDEF